MRRLAALCAVLPLLTGCGGDDDQHDTRAVTVQGAGTLRVEAKEYSFDPARVTVTGAGPLTIRLKNGGSLAHDIRLRRDGRDVGGTPAFPGGRTESARVGLRPGEYEFLCSVGDHAQLGMRGSLEVR